MEVQPPPIPTTPVTEIGSLVRAVEAERAGRYVEAWHEALKAIALRPFHPEAYIQMASTAVAAGDPEAALRAAQRALALTPKWPTAQQVVTALQRTLNAHRKQPKKANSIAWPALPDPNRKPRLSVCMIVKNEERFLGQCLASVRDIADELIVIDTGSTDRTVEIAREHGAQVGYFEWCNDFAAARNASIAPATGDWILFLDADEELSPAEKQSLPYLMSQQGISLYRLPIIDSHRGEESKSYVPRLFINPPGLQFVGCIHEGVITHIELIAEKWNVVSDYGQLKIIHHGYAPEILLERDKINRNYELLLQAIRDYPKEAYFYMQLGLELHRMGNKTESFERYQKALELAETVCRDRVTPEFRETLLTQYSTYLLVDQQYEKVLEVLTSDLALKEPLTPGQLLVRARALIHLRQASFALKDTQEAYARRAEATLFPSAIDPKSGAGEAMMAEALFINGRYQEAIEYFEIATECASLELRTVLAYAECLDKTGRISEAIEMLHKTALNRINIPAIWIHGARLLLQYPVMIEIAKEWVCEAKMYHPDDPGILGLSNNLMI
jgi:tetratricopeptide (TPR) repeat protein